MCPMTDGLTTADGSESRRCSACKGALEQRLIRYIQEYQGRVVIIDNVPAEVCTQCGEQFISPEVAKKIQSLVWGQAGEPKPVEADSYDFAEVA
jgi:YgiT-type zinc finger domain-containing protein